MIIDPTYCKRKILDVHGAQGAEWLARLPALAAECARRWDLELLPPFPVESYSYVAPVVRAGEPAVLKIGVPGSELACQAAALRHWNGSGTCRLLEADVAQGCLLMERVLPGEPLSAIGGTTAAFGDTPAAIAGDEEVTRVAVEVMRRLWKPAPKEHPFGMVQDRVTNEGEEGTRQGSSKGAR